LAKNLVKTTPWTFGQKLENELSALGFYISAHPLDQYKHLIAGARVAISTKLAEMPDRANVRIAANANSYSHRRTKSGKEMVSINASDGFGNIEGIAFGDVVANLMGVLSTETEVVLSGRLSNRDDRISLFVDSIIPMAPWVAGIAKKITLDIRTQSVLSDVK
jgi:DNA polymerase-3 subunit alpha